jgi:D-amino-acid dehydrogenase
MKGTVLDRVIIVGAGIVGLASALSLARRGLKVTVLDSARGPLQAASYAPGGYLGPAAFRTFVHPLSSFERMRKRISNTNTNEFLRYGIGNGQFEFLKLYLACCEPNRADELRLQLSSLTGLNERVLNSITADFGLEDYRSRSVMHVWRAQDDVERNQPVPSNIFGEVQSEALSLEQMRVRDPSLHAESGLAGALVSKSDSTINAAYLARQIAELCKKNWGVDFSYSTQVTGPVTGPDGRVCGVQTSRGVVTGQAVVLCAGIGSAEFLKSSGCREQLPIAPLTAASVSADLRDQSPNSGCSLFDEDCGMVFTAMDQRIRACSFPFLGHVDDKMIDEEYRRIYTNCRTIYGNSADWNRARYWKGTIGALPDALPALGELPSLPGLFLNCGHGMAGIATAWACADIVGDLIVGAAPLVDPSPYRPERFGAG